MIRLKAATFMRRMRITIRAPRTKEIRFVKVSQEMASASLEKGDVDAASVPGEMVDKLRDEGFTVIEGHHDWLAKIMVNHRKEPFSDVKFRQALYYAIDREDLVQTGLRGFGLEGALAFTPRIMSGTIRARSSIPISRQQQANS